VLKQSSGPTPAVSLEERFGKAKSSDVASSILNMHSFHIVVYLVHIESKMGRFPYNEFDLTPVSGIKLILQEAKKWRSFLSKR